MNYCNNSKDIVSGKFSRHRPKNIGITFSINIYMTYKKTMKIPAYLKIWCPLKLSTKPIAKREQNKSNYSNTNWELFKEKIEEKINNANGENNLNDRNDIDDEVIETSLSNWINIIKDTRDKIVPKRSLNYLIHTRESDYLKLLENIYKVIISKPFWTRHDLDVIKEIQRRLLKENLRLGKEAWETKINHLNEIYKDNGKFWGQVRNLIGNNKVKNEYLIDVNNNDNKVYKDEEKEILYHNIRQNIFEIPDEENRNFDGEN